MNKKVMATAIAAGVSFSAHWPAESAPTQAKSSSHQLLRFYTCNNSQFGGLFTGMFSAPVTGVKTYSINDNDPAAVRSGIGLCCRQVGIYIENLANQPGNGVPGTKVKQLSFTFTSKRQSTITDPNHSSGDWYGPENGPFVLTEWIDPNNTNISSDEFTISNPLYQGIVNGFTPPGSATGTNQSEAQNNANPHDVVFPTITQGLFNGLDVPTSPNNNSGPGPNFSNSSPWSARNLGIMTTHNGSFFLSNIKLNGVAINFDAQNPTVNQTCTLFSDVENEYDSFSNFGNGYNFDGNCGSGSCGGVSG